MIKEPCFVGRGGVTARRGAARRYSALGPAMLRFFAMHRAATAGQVRRHFAGRLRHDRTTRMHLQTLVAERELAVVREPGIAGRNVYVITSRGLRRAGEENADEHHARWRRRQTGAHLEHELLITELAVAVGESAAWRGNVRIVWQERFGFARHAAFGQLIPDFGFLFQHQSGRLVCLAEVSCGEESTSRLRQKLEAYAAWGESPEGAAFLTGLYRRHGAQSPRANFRLLVVAQNRRTDNDEVRLSQVFATVAGLPPEMRVRVWGTTAAELFKSGSADGAIWAQQRDLEEDVATVVSLPRHRRPSKVRALLRGIQRHSLFPTS